MKKHVIVISHERSGTHFLINSIAQCFDYSPQQVDMDNSRNVDWRDDASVSAWLQQFRYIDDRYILKTHHSAGFFSRVLPDFLDCFDIFYISRDGRDVMTSFWVYLNRLAPGWGPRVPTVGEFMRTPAAGGICQYQFHAGSITMLQRWVEHVRDWRAASGVNFVTYEDLHANFDETLERLARAIGNDPARVVRPGLESPSSLPWKGLVGTWQEYFTNDDRAYYDSKTQFLSDR